MMKSFVIQNVRCILPNGILPHASVKVENGRISDISTDRMDGNTIIDGDNLYLSPGFIDIHVHGGGGHDFMDGTPEAFYGALALHGKHGSTSIVPTTLTAEDEELETVFATERTVRYGSEACEYPEILGLHLEGPFVAPEMAGAQDPKYIAQPANGLWKKILNMAQGELRIWTVAPELPGAAQISTAPEARNILFSAGHSAARYADVREAVQNGYTMVTHLYSSMSTIIRENGYRVPGLLEAGLLHDELCAEVIADGMHLPVELLRLIYKTKGKDRMVLITDAMRGAGMPDGNYLLGSLAHGQMVSVFDGIAHMPDGISFAGSVATADRLLRVMVKQAGIPLTEAVQMLTKNPARELHIDNRKGQIFPGMDADLVLFDEDIQIHAVYRGGRKLR